jgi:hypothetical protein
MCGVGVILLWFQFAELKGFTGGQARIDEQYTVTVLEISGMFNLQLKVGKYFSMLERLLL